MLHIYRQITGLRRWKPVVICQKRENAEKFPFEEIVTLKKPATHALRRLWVKQILRRPVQIYASEARAISAAIRGCGGQVLHVYFGHIAVHLLPLLRRPPVPVIVSFHGADAMVDMDKPAYRKAAIEMLQLAALVLVRSESLASRIVELGCPREKVRIHRTGIPLAGFPFRERAFPTDGAWRFFQACRLIPKKGLHTSLRAFAAFTAKFPESRFAIAGEGPLLDDLIRFSAELGIADKVEFTGFLSQDALKERLYRAHVFLHPSELGADGNQEGVPNSMLEAMCTGLPVLATHHGGIPEAVDNGVSGFLVAERDHDGLAAGMFELASTPSRYAQVAQAAAKSVAERFEQSRQIAVLESCYSEAANRR